MTWKDLTVAQYQLLYPVITDKELDNLEREVKAIALMEGINEDDADNMPFTEYKELRKKYAFIHDGAIEGRAVKVIKTNGRSYKVMHDLKEVAIARYVEVKHFSAENFIPNLHLVIASIVTPEKGDYDAKKHSEYAEDMKKARFVDVYHTAVFFYALFSKTITLIPDYLEKNLMNLMKMNQEQASQYATSLCNDMAGYTI